MRDNGNSVWPVMSDIRWVSSPSHSIMDPGRLSNGSWYIMVGISCHVLCTETFSVVKELLRNSAIICFIPKCIAPLSFWVDLVAVRAC